MRAFGPSFVLERLSLVYDDETLDYLISKLRPTAVIGITLLSAEWSEGIFDRQSSPVVAWAAKAYPGAVQIATFKVTKIVFRKDRNQYESQTREYRTYRLTALGLALKAKLEG